MLGSSIDELVEDGFDILWRIQVKGVEFVKVGERDNQLVASSYYLVDENEVALSKGFDEGWVTPEGDVIVRDFSTHYKIEKDGCLTRLGVREYKYLLVS